MGRLSRDTGARSERAVVHSHHDAGIAAEKVRRSGDRGADLTIADTFTAEVTARKTGAGFTPLEAWFGDADRRFLKRNQAQPLVLLRWETSVQLLRGALRLDTTMDDTHGQASV
jgi:hypothetical protein